MIAKYSKFAGKGLTPLAKACPSIEQLCLTQCSSLDPDFLGQFPSLKLFYSGDKELTKMDLLAIESPHLTALCVPQIFVNKIPAGFSNVRYLAIADEDTDLGTITEKFSKLKFLFLMSYADKPEVRNVPVGVALFIYSFVYKEGTIDWKVECKADVAHVIGEDPYILRIDRLIQNVDWNKNLLPNSLKLRDSC